MTDYIAALRELAMNCNLSAPEWLEEMLWDRLVCGVNHQGKQQRLLSKGDLTYKDVLALAQSIECTESDTKKLGSTTPRPNYVVHRMQPDHKPPPPPPPQNHSYQCGGPHLANKCKHKDTQCWYCKKKGYLAKVCHAKSRDSTALKQPSKMNFMKNIPAQEEPGQHESLWETNTILIQFKATCLSHSLHPFAQDEWYASGDGSLHRYCNFHLEQTYLRQSETVIHWTAHLGTIQEKPQDIHRRYNCLG